jgi:hypothetical protein
LTHFQCEFLFGTFGSTRGLIPIGSYVDTSGAAAILSAANALLPKGTSQEPEGATRPQCSQGKGEWSRRSMTSRDSACPEAAAKSESGYSKQSALLTTQGFRSGSGFSLGHRRFTESFSQFTYLITGTERTALGETRVVRLLREGWFCNHPCGGLDFHEFAGSRAHSLKGASRKPKEVELHAKWGGPCQARQEIFGTGAGGQEESGPKVRECRFYSPLARPLFSWKAI